MAEMSKKTTRTVAVKTAKSATKPAGAKALAKIAPVAKRTAAPAAPAAAKPAPSAPAAAKPAMRVSDEQRYRMVAEAAYYRAESNQFKSDPLRDWIEAESDITLLLSGGK